MILLKVLLKFKPAVENIGNPERQRQFYSGQQKRHSIKNNLIIERRTRKIKGLSTTCEGKKHDKKLADEQALRFPKGSKLWKDTGLQGYEPAGLTTLQAKEKPKGANPAPQSRRPIGVSPRKNSAPAHALICDNVSLEQVCYNLLQNAAQAVFEQSTKTILFQTRVRGQRVLLKIQDSGIGIPKSWQA